ncbi:juvenile hormone esterase-like [Drosophila tropicalis]|uniref:juvenile hormone esterase-like n=1 Tax=Drosophila tropicalis TaxID=46794 RepID=UPI0035AB6916
MFKSHLYVACICVYVTFVSAFDNHDPLVVCPPRVGCIRGTHMNGYQTQSFQAFMGIPYAKPPIGPLRFKNPQDKPKWKGTYNATMAKMDCIQKNYLLPTPIIYGEEDCLHLNVYRPEVRSDTLPVMVYIHGGGFFSGSAGPYITGPEYFMDTQEVILVTMAYRLGPLGFLSTGHSDMPGNFGLKDQNLALRWVRYNIASFGGNRNKVTIFGQSAGGVSTHMHLLSPLSNNLFQRVISMSGTANVPFAINNHPEEQARKLAELCGIDHADLLLTSEITEALRKLDVIKLINAGDGLKYWDVDPLTNFRAVVEPPGEGAFLTALPEVLIKRHEYQKRPWLIGTVPDEGAVRVVNIIHNDTLLRQFNDRFEQLFEALLEWPTWFSPRTTRDKTDSVVFEYLQNVNHINTRTRQGFMDVVTDRGFKHSLYDAIRWYVANRPSNRFPVYMYRFNYKGPYSYASLYTQANVTGIYGVVHCDDLIYLFRSPILFPDFPKDSRDAKVIEWFVRYFVNFASNGYMVDAPPMKYCDAGLLESQPDGICEYHEFVNDKYNPSGFELRVNTEFPTRRIRLWQELLDERA